MLIHKKRFVWTRRSINLSALLGRGFAGEIPGFAEHGLSCVLVAPCSGLHNFHSDQIALPPVLSHYTTIWFVIWSLKAQLHNRLNILHNLTPAESSKKLKQRKTIKWRNPWVTVSNGWKQVLQGLCAVKITGSIVCPRSTELALNRSVHKPHHLFSCNINILSICSLQKCSSRG